MHESDEVYLLSVPGTDAVKVRDDLMDVKHLVQVDDDGLEQWVPVMKAGFPLSAADVGAVLVALGVDAAAAAWPGRRTRSPSSWPRWSHPHPDLLRGRGAQAAGAVHDRRLHGRADRGDAPAQAATRTFAIESEDPALRDRDGA